MTNQPIDSSELPEFGDYVTVEQKRFFGENEHYEYKVIDTLKSNNWRAVPVDETAPHNTRGSMEWVVDCVNAAVGQHEIERFRVSDIRLIRTNSDKVTELENLVERLKLEAQIHAGEDRSHKASLLECYQAVGAQKGDWNGAQPVHDYVAKINRLVEAVGEIKGAWRSSDGYVELSTDEYDEILAALADMEKES